MILFVIQMVTILKQYVFYNKDPRRLQPLVNYIVNQFHAVDFNGETTFDVVQVLSYFRAFYEELRWKFVPWTNEIMDRCWGELSSEHEDVSTILEC